MSSVKEKIEQFKSKRGINDFDDYFETTIDEYAASRDVICTSNEDFFEIYWEDYANNYLGDLKDIFSTQNEEELFDIIHMCPYFPYIQDNFKNSSNKIKIEVLKSNSVGELDSSFFTPELREEISREIISGHSNPADFCKAVFNDAEIMKTLCAFDGKMLRHASSGAITEELMELAMQNGFTLEDVSTSRGLCSSTEGMKYICKRDGKMLKHASSGAITEKLIELAMQNGFTLEDVSTSRGLCSSKKGMNYICKLDGKMLKHASSSAIAKELMEIAMQNGFTLDDVQFSYGLCSSIEGMKYICKLDGKMLKFADFQIITNELIEIAMTNEDENKCFGVKDARFNHYFYSSEEKMTYACKLDGRMLECLNSSFITEDIVRIAMTNENESKRFKLDQVEHASGLRASTEGMKYICKLDGRMIHDASSGTITKELVDIALNNKDANKRCDLRQFVYFSGMRSIDDMKVIYETNGTLLNEWIVYHNASKTNIELVTSALKSQSPFIPTFSVLFEHFSDNQLSKTSHHEELISVFNENLKNNKYNEFQIENMIKGVANQDFVRSEIFQIVLKNLSNKYNLDYENARYCFDMAIAMNDEILTNLNFEFLQDKYIPLYYSKSEGYQKLFDLGRYPEVQDTIISYANPKIETDGTVVIDEELGNARLSLLGNLLNTSLIKPDGEIEERWIPIYAPIISSLSSHTSLYDNLINSGEPLSETDYKVLVSYVLGKHTFEINSLEDLRNYDVIRENYINDILNNPNSDLELLKGAMLEKIYGISLTTATELWKPYSEGVLSSPKDFSEDKVAFFSGLSKIMIQDAPEVLRQVALGFEPDRKLDEHQVIAMKTTLKKELTTMYNDTLYKVDGKEVSGEIDGIKVYKAAGENGDLDFNLSISSLGAYSEFDPYVEGFSYKEDWNRPKLTTHGFCTSYVGNNYLGTARIKHSVLGFTDYGDSSMCLCGPYDLSSQNIKFDLTEDEMGNIRTAQSEFLVPKKMLDRTRHTHNEIVFERREGNSKKQPSYVVFFCDEYDEVREKHDKLLEVLEDSNLAFNHSSKEQIRQSLKEKIGKDISNETWDMVCSFYDTLKTAKDFGDIPIVVVERKKIAENEHKKIFGDTEEYKGLLARFRDETDLNRETIQQYYHDIIVEFENNYAGNKAHHDNIVNEFFGDEQKAQIINVISQKIRSIENLDTVDMMLEELERVIESDKSQMVTASSFISYLLKNSVTELRREYKIRKFNSIDVENVISEEVLLENRHEPKYVSDFLEGKINDGAYLNEYNHHQLNYPNQYDMTEVVSMLDDDLKGRISSTIDTMYEKGLYEGREQSAHSAKHIEDVILFAGLIGKQVGLDSYEMDLLMEAAMYHDAGRVNDAREDHALASANLAFDKLIDNLGDKYTAGDIRVIASAIAYHEKDDMKDSEGKQTYSNLDSICEGFRLDTNNPELMNRVRRIADCLKDADALDRTRFLADTRHFTNPEYLRYDSSRSLIKVATQLNESYAVQDIAKESMASEQARVMLEDSLLSTNSPKETIRAYRKGYLTSNNVVNQDTYSADGGYGGK